MFWCANMRGLSQSNQDYTDSISLPLFAPFAHRCLVYLVKLISNAKMNYGAKWKHSERIDLIYKNEKNRMAYSGWSSNDKMIYTFRLSIVQWPF